MTLLLVLIRNINVIDYNTLAGRQQSILKNYAKYLSWTIITLLCKLLVYNDKHYENIDVNIKKIMTYASVKIHVSCTNFVYVLCNTDISLLIFYSLLCLCHFICKTEFFLHIAKI